jgi:hypothetical protein
MKDPRTDVVLDERAKLLDEVPAGAVEVPCRPLSTLRRHRLDAQHLFTLARFIAWRYSGSSAASW